ncbi:MAG: hypothetical protein KW788_02030 [Candidatus Doudnabacteria bacterium]|nr:hypothetical protein [Candidatus Doudnabacteria bacterium]
MQDLRSYSGENRLFEASAAYKVWRQVSAVGGYTRLSLAGRYENTIPYGYYDGGLVTTYSERQTYRGIELGARSDFAIRGLTLEPEFLLYPRISRNFRSHQNYLGHVYDNDIDQNTGRRVGMQMSGRAKYALVRHLAATFSYNLQVIRTTNKVMFGGPARESLKTRTAMVGLQVGF